MDVFAKGGIVEIPVLETERLILPPLTLHDAAAIQCLFPRWEVVRYLGPRVPWPYPADGALTFIRDVVLPAVAEGREWVWTLRLKTNPEAVIGVIHLMAPTPKRDDNRGFWLDVDHHGQGLMSEASSKVTDFWFDALGFESLRISKATVNEASSRISKRQGMHVLAREARNYIGGRFIAETWEITREEWRARRDKLSRTGSE